MKDFQGRVAVVTGGASGIGKALAKAFLGEGMKVVLADVEEAALKATAEELAGDVIGVVTDVSDANSVQALAARVFDLHGACHILCNNAGVAAPTAGTYLATLFHALSTLAVRAPDGDFEALTAEAMTPGGLNRQALGEIRAAGGFKAFLAALDAILARLGEAVPKR